MIRNLIEIARTHCAGSDPSSKPVHFYEVYERYVAPLVDKPITLMELGVHDGKSLKIWASYFARGTVIGIDLADPGPDFSDHTNIIYASADQSDVRRLETIQSAHAPDGLDIIIDDASHVGYFAAVSFATLFPHLKSGGLYIVEDWATGYFDDWPDGGHYQKIRVEPVDGLAPKRLPSHDFGMVGFVKSLVDDVAGDNLRSALTAPPSRADTVEFMHLYKGFAVLKKH